MLERLSGTARPLDDGPPWIFGGRFVHDQQAWKKDASGGDDDLTAWIIAVARDRNREAFAALFNHFAPRLKAYMRRGGLGDEAAEDIAQEAMVQVWRKAHTFDPRRAAVSTWVFTIARNKRIDRLRRESRPGFDEDGYRAEQENTAQGPVEELELEQASSRVRDLVAALPEEQQEVIEKAFFEDKPHSEIATELSLPLGTVKSRIRLALSRLKSGLPDEVV